MPKLKPKRLDFSDKDRDSEPPRQAPQIKQSKSEPIVQRHLETDQPSADELRDSRQGSATRKSQSRIKVTNFEEHQRREGGGKYDLQLSMVKLNKFFSRK